MSSRHYYIRSLRVFVLCQREDGVLPTLVAGIFANDFAYQLKSTLSARVAKPEDGLTPHLFRLAGRKQLFQRGVRGRIGMQRDSGHCAIRFAQLLARLSGCDIWDCKGDCEQSL